MGRSPSALPTRACATRVTGERLPGSCTARGGWAGGWGGWGGRLGEWVGGWGGRARGRGGAPAVAAAPNNTGPQSSHPRTRGLTRTAQQAHTPTAPAHQPPHLEQLHTHTHGPPRTPPPPTNPPTHLEQLHKARGLGGHAVEERCAAAQPKALVHLRGGWGGVGGRVVGVGEGMRVAHQCGSQRGCARVCECMYLCVRVRARAAGRQQSFWV